MASVAGVAWTTPKPPCNGVRAPYKTASRLSVAPTLSKRFPKSTITSSILTAPIIRTLPFSALDFCLPDKMRKSSGTKQRKVTPPSPSYMSKDQFGMIIACPPPLLGPEPLGMLPADMDNFCSPVANYLSGLRSGQTTRPGGARPLPQQSTASRTATTNSRNSLSRYSLDAQSLAESQQGYTKPPSHAPSVRAGSVSSRYSMGSSRGRDYYPPKPAAAAPLRPSQVVPTATYMERGHRWMEKEEVCSLRDAMEEMGTRDAPQEAGAEDSRVYNAALDEAAELVWQHQNGHHNPKPDGPYAYRPHLRKNSYAHARTASIGAYGDGIAPSGLGRDAGSRSVSGSSAGSAGSSGSRPSVDSVHSSTGGGRKAKPYGSVGAAAGAHHRRTSLKRDISGEIARPFSGDQIWEEPEAAVPNGAASSGRASPNKLTSKPQNPLNHALPVWPPSGAGDAPKPLNRVEIHRNTPSQSRNPQYRTNQLSSQPELDPSLERKSGMEIRTEDIRAATGRKLSDRSPRLPEPTAVSDSPGRPIVSFDANWRAPEESTDISPDRPTPLDAWKQSHPAQPTVIPSIDVAEVDAPARQPAQPPGVPSICVAGPDDDEIQGSVPSINVPTINVATINVPTINVPSISVGDESGNVSVPVIVTPDSKPAGSSRPLPNVAAATKRPAARAQVPRSHWSRAPGIKSRTMATCHECGFPIEGRFVSLRGTDERFHPQCFSCFSCGIGLEAMEISPEPDTMRMARLERIDRRAAGEVLEEEPGMTMAEDGDERLRFYCHLDWHELFAPRCKHCKTPIIGEHVVALGEHWHNGHFFCAECGDPFEHGMTHIEKDGYAWCINCQTKRTERRAPKCKMCKTPVIGEYIQALGGEWHEQCFRCAECEGGFDDGQIFTKEADGVMVVLCTGCRTRELKA